jgi:type I site-specific restriction endonuclease
MMESRMHIFDVIRKKFVLITPEEWVRQHFVHFLVNHYKYPRSMIRLEGGLKYNALNKRSDIVVYSRDAKPWMLIECKAPEVPLDQSVLDQAAQYNLILKAPYLVATNGLKHFCCEIDHEEQYTAYLQDLPPYTLVRH